MYTLVRILLALNVFDVVVQFPWWRSLASWQIDPLRYLLYQWSEETVAFVAIELWPVYMYLTLCCRMYKTCCCRTKKWWSKTFDTFFRRSGDYKLAHLVQLAKRLVIWKPRVIFMAYYNKQLLFSWVIIIIAKIHLVNIWLYRIQKRNYGSCS